MGLGLILFALLLPIKYHYLEWAALKHWKSNQIFPGWNFFSSATHLEIDFDVKLQRAVHHKGKEGYYAHILIPDSRPCLLEVLYYSADISMPSQYNKLDANKDIVPW